MTTRERAPSRTHFAAGYLVARQTHSAITPTRTESNASRALMVSLAKQAPESEHIGRVAVYIRADTHDGPEYNAPPQRSINTLNAALSFFVIRTPSSNARKLRQ